MPSIVLSNISKPIDNSGENYETPLSFSEWKNRNIGISFSDAETQYNNYKLEFYRNSTKVETEAADKIKNDYKNLIKQLGVLFKDSEEFSRYQNADLDSSLDLALVIPFYAKKLKEVALFYVRKREELKNKKLEYNLVGSHDGLKRILENKLISKFSKTENNFFNSENPIFSNSPEFSAISENLSIDIEELYDTHNYYNDEENLNPFACVFNNLCYSLFSTPLSAKADPIESLYICEPSGETVDSLIQKAYSKYLSTRTVYVSGGYYTEDYRDVEVPLQAGNNFFYWFSGNTVFNIPEGIYQDVNINELNWTGATGGETPETSDLIFVNAGKNLLQGAWLQDTNTVLVDAEMSATMIDGKIFKFPFSDYGTSAVGGEWSGPGIVDTNIKSRKFFPTEEEFTSTQENINALYWSSFSSISTVRSVYLQETSLGSGGYASNNFYNADKLYINYNSENTFLSNNIEIAWLYDFRQTQIPVLAGDNKIYFPIQKYEENSELFFNYVNGNAIPLSSVDVANAFAGAVAAENIEEADWIIKNNTICGPEIEVAWLKAVPLQLFTPSNQEQCGCEPNQTTFYTDWAYVSGGAQASLSFLCYPGQYVRFVWNGDTININELAGFTGFLHDDSCEYKNLDHSVSIENQNVQNNNNQDLFEKWKKCSCGAIQHSPFGHNADSIERYKITPDFIVKDEQYPKLFNKKTWKGRDEKDYNTSSDSAHFYPNLIEKDLGWGSGTWKNQSGGSFILEKGESYIYFRSDANNCNFESPYFLINHPYKNGLISDENCDRISFLPSWYKAVKDESGNWIDTGEISDMNLNFGDYITYRHRSSTSETKKRLLYNGTEITSVSGDFVKLDNTDPNISYTTFTNKNDSINFLIKIPLLDAETYWGEASFGENSDKQFLTSVDSKQHRIIGDYLRVTQPPPSKIVLGDKTVMQYKFGNCEHNCFIWSEKLKFDVISPVRKWNKIDFNTCVQSDILNYLNKEITNCYTQKTLCYSDCSGQEKCGCYHYCTTNKTGASATHISSDIILNTELSGIPLFVNYYARNSFTATLSTLEISNGDKSKLVPFSYNLKIDPISPWRDLLNQEGSNFVVEENIENLKTTDDLNFYNPKRMSMNRFETFDSRVNFSPSVNRTEAVRVDNYFDSPFSKAFSDSSYVTKFSLGEDMGTPSTTKRQVFTPYTNSHEKNDKPFYGLYDKDLSFSPWSRETGNWKESDLYKNFRNQYDINCGNNWYTDQLSLTANVWNWQTDIYGNEYYTVVENLSSEFPSASSYGKIYIKNQSGHVLDGILALSSISTVYQNVSVDLYDPFDGI